MKLLIVRHGDPDYSIDSLTEKGWKEAELLKTRMAKLTDPYFYCSPLGRARATAEYTLEKLGRQAQTLDWLRAQQRCASQQFWSINLHVKRNLSVTLSYQQLCRSGQFLVNACNGTDTDYQGHHTNKEKLFHKCTFN